jgi:hypothetical protein
LQVNRGAKLASMVRQPETRYAKGPEGKLAGGDELVGRCDQHRLSVGEPLCIGAFEDLGLQLGVESAAARQAAVLLYGVLPRFGSAGPVGVGTVFDPPDI